MLLEMLSFFQQGYFKQTWPYSNCTETNECFNMNLTVKELHQYLNAFGKPILYLHAEDSFLVFCQIVNI